MTNTQAGGTVSGSGDVRVERNPAPVALLGMPTFVGTTAKATIDRDGNVSIAITGIATYGNPEREISVVETINADTTEIDELLRNLMDVNRDAIARRTIRAAIRAWEVAIKNREMEMEE